MDFKVLIGQSPDVNGKFQGLSIICEEAVSSKELYVSEPFDNLSGFDFDTRLPPVIVDFDSHGEDSDESLGILPLDLLDGANEVFSKNSKDFVSFEKIDSEHDFIDNLNIVKENLFKANDSLVDHGIPDLSTLHVSELQDNLNYAQAVNSAQKQNDLNVTLTLHNHTSEYDDDDIKAIVSNMTPQEECQSSVCTLPNLLSHYKFEESPIHKIESSPKYSSTPKHDINTTFALDEKFLNSEQNLSPVSTLNKTFNKVDALQENMLANIDKLNPVNVISGKTAALSPETGRNILNITCSITTPLHHQDELNKTFNNVAKEINVTVTYPEEIENTCNLKYDKRDEIKITASNNEKNENIQRNVSNIGISLPEGFGNKVEALNLIECEVTTDNTLKIPLVSEDFENDFYEEDIQTDVLDKTHILNTTYEKIDELPQSSKLDSSKFQKPSYKQVGMTNISKIAKGICFSPFSSNVSSYKSAKPDKKSIRKSICDPVGNNIKKLNREALKRRQTFGSTLIENKDVIGPNLISQATKNTANSSHYSMSKNSIGKKSCSGFLKFTSKSEKSSAEASRISSDLSFSIPRVPSEKTKVELSGEDKLQLKQLGKTLSRTEKTVIKKPILPPSKTSNKCEIPRLTAQISDRKTSLPLSKQVNVHKKFEFHEKKIAHSRMPEKHILSQKNSYDASLPSASVTQILNRKSSLMGSSTNNYQTGSVASKIPTTTNRKIGNGEKAVVEKPKTYFKSSSHRNLR